jgi:hypothetical protein
MESQARRPSPHPRVGLSESDDRGLCGDLADPPRRSDQWLRMSVGSLPFLDESAGQAERAELVERTDASLVRQAIFRLMRTRLNATSGLTLVVAVCAGSLFIAATIWLIAHMFIDPRAPATSYWVGALVASVVLSAGSLGIRSVLNRWDEVYRIRRRRGPPDRGSAKR